MQYCVAGRWLMRVVEKSIKAVDVSTQGAGTNWKRGSEVTESEPLAALVSPEGLLLGVETMVPSKITYFLFKNMSLHGSLLIGCLLGCVPGRGVRSPI